MGASQDLAKKWDNHSSSLPVKFFVLYVKEAHLDWQAKTYEERLQRAGWHKQLCEINFKKDYVITTLIDDVDNKMGDAYGSNPNGITIIDPQGKIIYYADWYRYGDVDRFLTDLFKDKAPKAAASNM